MRTGRYHLRLGSPGLIVLLFITGLFCLGCNPPEPTPKPKPLMPGGQAAGAQLKPATPRPEPAANIYEKTFTLPLPISNSKMLLKLLILHWQSDAPSAPILKINMAAEAAQSQESKFCSSIGGSQEKRRTNKL